MRSKYFSATTPIHKEFLGKLKDSLAWDNKHYPVLFSGLNSLVPLEEQQIINLLLYTPCHCAPKKLQ